MFTWFSLPSRGSRVFQAGVPRSRVLWSPPRPRPLQSNASVVPGVSGRAGCFRPDGLGCPRFLAIRFEHVPQTMTPVALDSLAYREFQYWPSAVTTTSASTTLFVFGAVFPCGPRPRCRRFAQTRCRPVRTTGFGVACSCLVPTGLVPTGTSPARIDRLVSGPISLGHPPTPDLFSMV